MNSKAPLSEDAQGNNRSLRTLAGLTLLAMAGIAIIAAVLLSVPDWIGILIAVIFLIALPLNWKECVDALARTFARIKSRRR